MVKKSLKILGILLFTWVLGGLTSSYVLCKINTDADKSDLISNYELETKSGLTLRGTLLRVPSEKCVILLHGIRSSRIAMTERARLYGEQGYDCLLLDLRAHGLSDGTFTSFGWNESDDLVDIYFDLKTKYNKVGIHGCSLGAVTAIYSARHKLPYNFMVLESPYDNIDHAFRHRLNDIQIPSIALASVRWGLWMFTGVHSRELNTMNHARFINYPTLHLAGTKESQIPIHESDAIFETIGSNQKWNCWFEGAQHQDLMQYNTVLYSQTLIRFLNEVSANSK